MWGGYGEVIYIYQGDIYRGEWGGWVEGIFSSVLDGDLLLYGK